VHTHLHPIRYHTLISVKEMCGGIDKTDSDENILCDNPLIISKMKKIESSS